MAVETVAYIRTVGNPFDNPVFCPELLDLKPAQTLRWCSINGIEDMILFLKLCNFFIDVHHDLISKVGILGNRLAVV